MKLNPDLLGKPGTGVHSVRLFDLAVMDILFTIVFAYIISKKFKKDFKLVLIICFISGIVLHRIFGVKTTIDHILFD
jgi:hypothetical protein